MKETDLRVIKTKESIHQALLECLDQYPFKKITVDKVTERARVNRSTFYKYYTDKFDLLDRYLEFVLETFRSHMNTDFVKASKDDIRRSVYSEYFKYILNYFKSSSHMYRILWHADMDRDLFTEMNGILQRSLLDIIRTDAHYDESKESYAVLYSSLFAQNCMTTVRWWMESCPERDIAEIGKLMKSNMEQGFFQTYRAIMEDVKIE